MIRQIGDRILHSATRPYHFDNLTELKQQLKIMRSVLYQNAGVGIAANQCEQIKHPYQIVIVGSNDSKARLLGKQRYPEKEIPQEIVMINPKIMSYAGEPYYPGEGCLSVKGSLRGKVARYPEVTITFYNETGKELTEIYHNFAAHIAQHEIDHLSGKVFLQSIIEELTLEELQLFKKYIEDRLADFKPADQSLPIQPVFAFQRDELNHLYMDEEILNNTLLHMDSNTLQGIKKILRKNKLKRGERPS